MIKLLRCLVLVFVLLLANQGLGQASSLIQNINARQTTDLDGRWQVIVDPYDVGALDYRAQPIQGNSAFFKNYKPRSESELVEYDFDASSGAQRNRAVSRICRAVPSRKSSSD